MGKKKKGPIVIIEPTGFYIEVFYFKNKEYESRKHIPYDNFEAMGQMYLRTVNKFRENQQQAIVTCVVIRESQEHLHTSERLNF